MPDACAAEKLDADSSLGISLWQFYQEICKDQIEADFNQTAMRCKLYG